jgi:prephenate dehydratase
MPIAHHLMIHPDNSIEDIERIYSHPQALAQSFHFLDTHYKEIPKQDFLLLQQRPNMFRKTEKLK